MFTKIVYSGSIVYNTALFIFLRRKQNRRNAGEAVPIWRAAWLSVCLRIFRGGSGRAGSSPVPVVPVALPGVVSGRLAHRGASPCRPVSMGGAVTSPERCARRSGDGVRSLRTYNNRCVRVFAFWAIYYI